MYRPDACRHTCSRSDQPQQAARCARGLAPHAIGMIAPSNMSKCCTMWMHLCRWLSTVASAATGTAACCGGCYPAGQAAAACTATANLYHHSNRNIPVCRSQPCTCCPNPCASRTPVMPRTTRRHRCSSHPALHCSARCAPAARAGHPQPTTPQRLTIQQPGAHGRNSRTCQEAAALPLPHTGCAPGHTVTSAPGNKDPPSFGGTTSSCLLMAPLPLDKGTWFWKHARAERIQEGALNLSGFSHVK